MSNKPPPSSLALDTEGLGDHEAQKKKDTAVPQSQSPHPGASDDLTPPVTPTVGPNASPAPTPLKPTDANPNSRYLSIPVLQAPGTGGYSTGSTKAPRDASTVLEFLHDIDLKRDETGSLIQYGRGLWSVVYEASSAWSSSPSPDVSTPPLSPVAPNRLLAVKSPLRRDAHSVLKEEARIMTRLLHVPGKEKHVVPFHGFMSPCHSIVMTAIPLTLAAHITKQATAARETFSTRTMFQPVIGMSQWLSLARSLIEGLSWLHNRAHVVHGDIKPHNILLNSIDSSFEQAKMSVNLSSADTLYADFSSSHEISCEGTSSAPVTSSSALTTPYAAPEFLSVSSLKSFVPSTASDVFSLAVTLVAAATGDILLYPGSSSMQRLALSKDGHRVLEHVRSTSNGARVPRNGVVDRVLKPAVSKVPEDRTTPDEWLEMIDREEFELKSQSITS
jgi:serine/threonine protein kinase